ncbi:sugar ABC transporter ATP-binding protein [Marinivivus vitaminiproducens]|uniref:sugar ABC transporter ATP-binding protein n=1 Tax=Marinivivus vitaminiproducens TaxID=3035935 RepID=UPI0027A39DFD|nr:sugar ABC transporter ATP-binding protein [Geminicoccaceae bacterium SCSIO 64248]
MTPVLAARNVTKRFGAVAVLEKISFDLVPGELHALIGENGAGKSTLMKILSGYEPVSDGEIILDGRPVTFASNPEAERAGIVLVHQEFNLAEQLDVASNIFLGREVKRGLLLDHRAMASRAAAVLAELDTHIDPRARIDGLSVSDKQRVEIAKAVSRTLRVLLLDEPTAVLTPREAESLFQLIVKLKEQGVAIVYTSHKLDEVRRLADRVTVLRDGRHVATEPGHTLTEDDMATLMVGREMSSLFPAKRLAAADAPVRLEVRGLSVPGRVHDAGFTVRAGEILGFAGLVGSGRTELAEGVVGLLPTSGGTVLRNGKPVTIRRFDDAVAAGIGYLTEDRKGRGLLLEKDLVTNLTLLGLDRFSRGLIDRKAERRALDDAIRRYDIRVRDRSLLARQLSGGNQQKLLIAKTMLVEPEVVIFDEPTRGIDIGTKQQIYELLTALAREGKAVVVISSEMPEVIGLAHRVVVMCRGRIAGELSGDLINEDEIVRYATGLKGEGVDVERAA